MVCVVAEIKFASKQHRRDRSPTQCISTATSKINVVLCASNRVSIGGTKRLHDAIVFVDKFQLSAKGADGSDIYLLLLLYVVHMTQQ